MILEVKDISVKSFAEFMFVLAYTSKVLSTKSTKAYCIIPTSSQASVFHFSQLLAALIYFKLFRAEAHSDTSEAACGMKGDRAIREAVKNVLADFVR